MTADQTIDQFNQELDELLGLGPRQELTPAPAASDLGAAMQTASLLIEMNLDAESSPRSGLLTRWKQQTRRLNPDHPARSRFYPRLAWIAILLIILVLLTVFHQPVFAAVERLFGYIYIPSAGFLPINSTLVLKQPIVQEHNGGSLTVMQGVATPTETILMLTFSDTAHPGDGAWLETETGARLDISSWQYSPNTPGSHGLTLTFPALPAGVKQTTLALPEGWRLPLTWLPAAQAQVLQVGVIPYPNPTQAQVMSQADLCQASHGIQLCVLAATASSDQTVVLIEGKTIQGNLKPEGNTFRLVQQTNDTPMTIETGSRSPILKGTEVPIGNESPFPQKQLIFPPLPEGGKTVKLSIPAILASVDINQSITVDMGADPEPGEIVPVQADVQVMGTTVRFRQATFIGDGVNSLRLTLVPEPVETVDGVTPISLEMGRPERVDDIYGGGSLFGSQGLFVELIQGSEKLTGVLTLPIVQATLSLQGPFVYHFTISQSVPEISTPAVANPADYTPMPSSTPVPLDGYSYSGLPLDVGELLFSVITGDKTDLYLYKPGQAGQAKWFATLPGAANYIYIHPDHQGIDYLAGTRIDDPAGFYNIRGVSIYSLRFEEKLPRLLYSFPWGTDDVGGWQVSYQVTHTIVPSWSYDGRYLLFKADGIDTAPGSPVSQFGWIDMTCRIDGNCVPHYLPIPFQYDLGSAFFSPNNYHILFSGSVYVQPDNNSTFPPDIFLMKFDPKQPDSPITNLTNSGSTHIASSGFSSGAVWFPDGHILSFCHDLAKDPTEADGFFCIYDPQTGIATYTPTIREPVGQVQVSPSGHYILAIVYKRVGVGAGNNDLCLFDVTGQPVSILANEREFDKIAMSLSDQYVAFIFGGGNQLGLVDVVNKQRMNVYGSDGVGLVSWLGWVR